MSRWFRHYAGMMRDEKLVRVAIRTGQSIERVLWIWGAILESAAEIDDEGRYDLDAGEVAYFLRAGEDDVRAVLSALKEMGRIDADRVANWAARQFLSDRSAERVRRHRDKKKGSNNKEVRESDDCNVTCNSDVTLQGRFRNAPETETETETETEIELPNGNCRFDSENDQPEGSENLEGDNPGQSEKLKPEHVVAAWNQTASRFGLPVVRKLTDQRRRALNVRIRQHSIDEWTEAIAAIERNPWLQGQNDRGWRADFDFLLQPKSFARLIEGGYDRI